MHKAKRDIASTKTPNVHRKYSIIIPSAGCGSRMVSYGVKSLIKIRNETIIERQLRLVKEVFRDYQTILIVGFQADKLMNATPNNIIKVENESYQNNNVLRSIGMGLRACTTEDVVIIYGDLVFNKPTINVPFGIGSTVILCNTMSDPEIGCIACNGYIENFCYDLDDKWAQIVYLTGKELQLMKKIAWDKAKANLFGFEALNWIVDNGGKLKAYKPRNCKVMDIDSSKDIAKANNML
jgi:CTP:molybdopterin cytidylyltransferase MocA